MSDDYPPNQDVTIVPGRRPVTDRRSTTDSSGKGRDHTRVFCIHVFCTPRAMYHRLLSAGHGGGSHGAPQRVRRVRIGPVDRTTTEPSRLTLADGISNARPERRRLSATAVAGAISKKDVAPNANAHLHCLQERARASPATTRKWTGGEVLRVSDALIAR